MKAGACHRLLLFSAVALNKSKIDEGQNAYLNFVQKLYRRDYLPNFTVPKLSV